MRCFFNKEKRFKCFIQTNKSNFQQIISVCWW